MRSAARWFGFEGTRQHAWRSIVRCSQTGCLMEALGQCRRRGASSGGKSTFDSMRTEGGLHVSSAGFATRVGYSRGCCSAARTSAVRRPFSTGPCPPRVDNCRPRAPDSGRSGGRTGRRTFNRRNSAGAGVRQVLAGDTWKYIDIESLVANLPDLSRLLRPSWNAWPSSQLLPSKRRKLIASLVRSLRSNKSDAFVPGRWDR